jgi:hypothetical protein
VIWHCIALLEREEEELRRLPNQEHEKCVVSDDLRGDGLPGSHGNNFCYGRDVIFLYDESKALLRPLCSDGHPMRKRLMTWRGMVLEAENLNCKVYRKASENLTGALSYCVCHILCAGQGSEDLTQSYRLMASCESTQAVALYLISLPVALRAV